MDFGHALATYFPISSYIPQANVNAVNTGTLRPDAALHRNRYGALPSDVKGFPADHLQHGQSTFWLSDLFKEPAFLAEHPAFSGVVVAEPPSAQDYTDLCFAASPTLGGAYGYLKDWADRLGLLGSASGTGPHREPGGGARPVDPAPAPLPAPLAPPPVPQAPTTAGSPTAWTDADTAALIGLIERHLPGQGAQLAGIVRTAGKIRAAGATSAAFIAALPEIEAALGVSDPRIGAALGLLALFAS